MSDPLFEGDNDGNTPLEAEECEQLIPSYITTRDELNEGGTYQHRRRRSLGRAAEAQGARPKGFLNELHKQMYGDVCKWAGTCRTTASSIGIDA